MNITKQQFATSVAQMYFCSYIPWLLTYWHADTVLSREAISNMEELPSPCVSDHMGLVVRDSCGAILTVGINLCLELYYFVLLNNLPYQKQKKGTAPVCEYLS